MEHYLCHTDYPIWQVIQNGNGHVSVTTNTNGMIKVLPPKTTKEVVARERERKARTTLLMALPEDHLAKFYKIADAKEMWESIKSRFGGNDECKMMQKYLLKQQFEGFSVSALEGLHKGYERFQTLLSQLEIHGAGVSHEDANQKFLRDTVGFDKTKVECFNCHKIGHFARDCRAKGNQDSKRRDAGYSGNKARDNDVEEDTQNYAMMAYSSSNSGSDNETLDDESDAKTSENATCESDTSVETTTSMPATVEDAPKVVSKPKVWTDAPTIEEYKLDSDDDLVSNVLAEKEKPSFAFNDTISIFSHLIRDCDFCEKRIAKHAELAISKTKVTGQRENVPVWNNVQRVNHQNKFVPSVVLTKIGKFPVNAARENYSSQAASTSTASKVNNARPFINDTRPKKCFYKSHPPYKRHFHNKTAQINTFANHKVNTVNTSLSVVKGNRDTAVKASDDLHKALKDKGIIDSGCSRHITGNKAHLTDYQDFKGGSVAFGGSNVRITGKGKIKAGRLDFEDVYYVEELKHYNLFFVSQMCDKKKNVLFTDTDCLVLSPDFKLPDENHVLLKIPRQHNMYSFNIKNIDPSRDLSCLFAKALIDESNKWHRRLGHVNFKNINKLVKGNLVRGLPSKIFENNHTSVACQKGNQHKASWIKREYSNARISQQNRVAERKNRTLIEAARTMLADSFLPTTFWAEVVNTACYVLNSVLVTKPQNKTPYELLTENQANKSAGQKEAINSVGKQVIDDQDSNSEEIDLHDEHFVLPIWSAYSTNVKSSGHKIQKTTDCKTCEKPEATHDSLDANTNNTNLLNVVIALISVVGLSRALNDVEPSYHDDLSMPHLEDIFSCLSEGIFTNSSYDDEGVVTDFNNLETTMNVSPTPTTRIHTIHPKTQILKDYISAVQTRSKVKKNFEAHALFQIQKVWILVDLPFVKKAIRTKWVYRKKKDERGVVVRNKVRLVSQGHRQEEGINYDEAFALVARIEAIRIFLAFASYIGFIVYQMDVKSAFLYGAINKEVYVIQPPGFVDHKFPNKVYKVVKALYGLHQAPRALRGAIDKTLFFKQDKKDIMLVQVTPKTSQLQAMKMIFRYLKGQPKLGLWYPKVSSFDLEAYSDSDYAGVNLDRKSTTGDCQFLSRRLISWQCKKQTIVATSTTKAEYVVVAHCCGQVL
nr:retrovirus-related Pol polyprotein from transposon TNT 1-94 [Tanacetum cinerariifolium]